MSQSEPSNSKEFPTRHRLAQSISYTSKDNLRQPIPAYKQPEVLYQPTPPPETVIVHSIPKKTNDACCWGCATALCLCFGIKECCTS